MKLSEILQKMNFQGDFRILNEQEFSRLQLVGHESEERACTFLDDSKYLGDIKPTISMVLCRSDMDLEKIVSATRGACVVDNPRVTYFQVHNYLMGAGARDGEACYARETFESKIAASAEIADSAVIAKQNVVIGENVIIEDLVVIKENTVIGDNCIVRCGSVIGNNGFEFKRDGDRIMPVKHGGGVILGDNVIVGSNTVIDRAVYPWDNTVIGDECKIDSLAYIAHGVKAGKAILIGAQVSISGRVLIGNKAKIGQGTIIRNAIRIGDGADVSMGSVVTKDVADKEHVTGNFAIGHERFLEHIKRIR